MYVIYLIGNRSFSCQQSALCLVTPSLARGARLRKRHYHSLTLSFSLTLSNKNVCARAHTHTYTQTFSFDNSRNSIHAQEITESHFLKMKAIDQFYFLFVP